MFNEKNPFNNESATPSYPEEEEEAKTSQRTPEQ